MKNIKQKDQKEKPKVIPPMASAAPLQARSVAKYLRIGPRKLRPVINTIRFASVTKAFLILTTIKQKAARMAEKVLKSAAANAKVLGMDENRLYVADIRADGGPSMKRFMSRSMGRADKILKRMSHLSIILKENTRLSGSSQTQESLKKEEGSSKAAKTKAPAKKQSRVAAAKA